MKTVQFRYGADNLGYLVHGKEYALVVDGGAVKEIRDYLFQNKLVLKYVTNTHSHGDHTCGNRELIAIHEADYVDVESPHGINKINLEGNSIRVMHTPGHTADSVCFYYQGVLLAGDTLFNGKVGRCFSGDIAGFYESIKQILALPADTMVYSGHDYVLEYLDAAGKLEPENASIEDYRSRYSPDMVRATLGEEMKINPFIRFNEPEIVRMLKKRNLPVDTEFHRFRSIISLI